MATVNEKMTAIADSIRSKTGGTEKLNLDQMASEVGEVYEAGKKAKLVALWNTIQDNGNRRSYRYAFYDGTLTWADDIYYPQHPIICNANIYAAESLFNNNKHLIDTKVSIVLSNVRADNCFRGCVNLKRIPSLTLEKIVRFVNIFEKCGSLEELYMYGEVDIDGLDLKDCKKLSKASFESIVRVYSTTVSGLSCTFSKEAKEAAFTDEEWEALRSERPNVTFTFV